MQVRRATTKHVEMCGCVKCIVMHNLQKSLNSYRSKMLNILESKCKDGTVSTKRMQHLYMSYMEYAFANNNHRHAKPSDALKEIMCSTCNYGEHNFFQFKCILS